MLITIRLPALLADRIDGIDTVTLEATTVVEAVERLADRHPALSPLLLGPDRRIKAVMVIFLNDLQLSPADYGRVLRPGDRLDIVPAIEGGAHSMR